jgi:hypothetical protein
MFEGILLIASAFILLYTGYKIGHHQNKNTPKPISDWIVLDHISLKEYRTQWNRKGPGLDEHKCAIQVSTPKNIVDMYLAQKDIKIRITSSLKPGGSVSMMKDGSYNIICDTHNPDICLLAKDEYERGSHDQQT